MNRNHQCPRCLQHFSSAQRVKSHMERKIPCDIISNHDADLPLSENNQSKDEIQEVITNILSCETTTPICSPPIDKETQLKPYQCDTCKARFSRKSNMLVHQKKPCRSYNDNNVSNNSSHIENKLDILKQQIVKLTESINKRPADIVELPIKLIQNSKKSLNNRIVIDTPVISEDLSYDLGNTLRPFHCEDCRKRFTKKDSRDIHIKKYCKMVGNSQKLKELETIKNQMSVLEKQVSKLEKVGLETIKNRTDTIEQVAKLRDIEQVANFRELKQEIETIKYRTDMI